MYVGYIITTVYHMFELTHGHTEISAIKEYEHSNITLVCRISFHQFWVLGFNLLFFIISLKSIMSTFTCSLSDVHRPECLSKGTHTVVVVIGVGFINCYIFGVFWRVGSC